MAVIKKAKRDSEQKVKEMTKNKVKGTQKLGQKEANKGRKLGHTRAVQNGKNGW